MSVYSDLSIWRFVGMIRLNDPNVQMSKYMFDWNIKIINLKYGKNA